MKIRVLSILMAIAILSGSAVLVTSSFSETEPQKPVKIGFVHSVYFWLHEDTPKEAVQKLIYDCKKYLGSVKTVEKLAVGEPAGTDREVVDNSYAVNLIVFFKDKAAHDYYQEAEKHKQFIERNKEHWKRVQVYDMLPQ